MASPRHNHAGPSAAPRQALRRGVIGSVPRRNPGPMKEGLTFEPATPRKRPARYVVEIRDAAGTSLLLTSANWTDSERDQALLAVLRLVGMKAATPATRQGNTPRSVDQAPRAKAPRKT